MNNNMRNSVISLAIELKIGLFMAVLIALSLFYSKLNPFLGILLVKIFAVTFFISLVTFAFRLIFGRLSIWSFFGIIIPIYIALLAPIFAISYISEIAIVVALISISIKIFSWIFLAKKVDETSSDNEAKGHPLIGGIIIVILAAVGILGFFGLNDSILNAPFEISQQSHKEDGKKSTDEKSEEDKQASTTTTTTKQAIQYETFKDKVFGFSFEYPVQITGKINDRTDLNDSLDSTYTFKIDDNTTIKISNESTSQLSVNIDNDMAQRRNRIYGAQTQKLSNNSYSLKYEKSDVSIEETIFISTYKGKPQFDIIKVETKGVPTEQAQEIITHIISTFKPSV